eukprot:GHUV01027364.1.p3 GENE.GHUV01027364.1~~GHUV01027364.1.p3  ORF type:complete len:105 (-),score=33.18 GHUV01027364.1:850-1164(-)
MPFSAPLTPALLSLCLKAHLGAKVDGKLTMPNMPDLLTGPADDPDGVTLALPDNSSVQPPEVPGLDLSRGVAAVVEGKDSGPTHRPERQLTGCGTHRRRAWHKP